MKITKGSILKSVNCGDFEVLRFDSAKRKYLIRFLLTGTEAFFQFAQIKKGTVKDRMSPSVHGVGYLGIGEYKVLCNGSKTTAYGRWSKMILRCYDKKQQEIHPSYIGCSVHPNWLNFQTFAEWHYKNFPKEDGTKERYELDKDSIVHGNKVYSENTCSYLKQKVNVCDAILRLAAKKSDVLSLFYGDGYRMNISKSFLSEFCKVNAMNIDNLIKLHNGEIESYRGLTLKPVINIQT